MKKRRPLLIAANALTSAHAEARKIREENADLMQRLEEVRQLVKECEAARLEAAHVWHVLGAAQHRYEGLLSRLRRLLSGEPLEPRELEDIMRFVDRAPAELVAESALRREREGVERWWMRVMSQNIAR